MTTDTTTTDTDDTTTTSATSASVSRMPEDLRAEAEHLIRTLSASAGDYDEVQARAFHYCRGQSVDDALGGVLAALILIFAECITDPTEPGEYAEVSYPID